MDQKGLFLKARAVIFLVTIFINGIIALRFLYQGGYFDAKAASDEKVVRTTVRGVKDFLEKNPNAKIERFFAKNFEDAKSKGYLATKKVTIGKKEYHFFYFDPINYVDAATGEVLEANTNFIQDSSGSFTMNKANYQLKVPAFADGVLEYTFEGKRDRFIAQSVGDIPVSHIKGVVSGNRVTYSDAFGDGIDYVIDAEPEEFRKYVVFRKPIEPKNDLRIVFDTTLRADAYIKGNSREVDGIFFRMPRIWDSTEFGEPIAIRLENGKLTKIIPRSFFVRDDKKVLAYPVTTDSTGSYYSSAGDGFVGYGCGACTWASAHDAATGTSFDYATSNANVNVNRGSATNFNINRGYIPIDTSALTAGGYLSKAILYVYITQKTQSGSDANSTFGVVSTSQSSASALGSSDYSLISGSAGETKDYADITTLTYSTFLLNASGRTFINAGGTTKLGLREGHDLNDTEPTYTGYNEIMFSASETSGTASDPYLFVAKATASISSVTTEGSIYATSSSSVNITATMATDEDIATTTLDYVIYFDRDGNGAPTAGETYVTTNCAGYASWSSGLYTKQTTAFKIDSTASPKTDTVTCSNANMTQNGKYNIYVKWYDDASVTIATHGTATFQSCNQPTGTDNWYDSNYENRRILQFRNQDRVSALINFPVLMYASTTNFDLNALNSPSEVRFIDDDGTTVLQHELERYATTSEAVFWVQVPKVATSTACDYVAMYYDYTGSSDVATTTGVWDENYRAVYHFGQSSGNYNDSTRNAEHCTTVTVNSRSSTGPFGSLAPDFEATSANNRLTCGQILVRGDLTHEVWFQLESGSAARPITQHAASGETQPNNIIFGFETDSSNRFWSQHEHGTGANVTIAPATPITATVGEWTMATMVRSSSTSETYTFYKNGSQEGSVTTYTDDPIGGDTGTALYVGGRISSAVWFDGLMDELRISDSVRSDDWVAASASSTRLLYVDWGTEATTTAVAANDITQLHYRWRNDDGSESAATWGAVEDTATSSVGIGKNIRLRIEVSNDGSASSSQMYILQYGTASNPQSGTWTTVPESSSCGTAIFCMNDTANLTDGSATTNVASGLTDDPSHSFTAGQQKDTNATTTHISMNSTKFTEVEYAFQATNYAAQNTAYYFRLATTTGVGDANQLDAYTVTPQLTTYLSPLISSNANQTFTAGDPATLMATTTVSNGSAISITAANDIRIRIPDALDMTWDETATTTFYMSPILANYSDFYNTNDLPVVTVDTSDVTFNPLTNTLFFVRNTVGTETIYEHNLDGTNNRTVALHGFNDTEGIVWMYGTTYAVSQEAITDPVIIMFSMDGATTTVDRASIGTVITPTMTITANKGMEGVAYDPLNDWFYVSVEKQADGTNGGRVFQVEMDNTTTELTALGTALSGAGYTDLASIYYDGASGHLFLLAEENDTVIEATTGGTIIATRAVDTGIFTQPEGLSFTPDGSSMFLAGEADDYQRLTKTNKVGNPVSYENSNKTLVIDVTSDFTAGESFTFGGINFKNFNSASGPDNLELIIAGLGGATADEDDKTKTISSSGLSVTASSTLAFGTVSYDFSTQTSTAANVGGTYVAGGLGTWTLNVSCMDSPTDCMWKGVTEKDRFAMFKGASVGGTASTSGITCFDWSQLSCTASTGSCSNVTLSTGYNCYSTAKTDVTMATGSGASGTYWFAESDWAQAVPGRTTASLYTTTLIWDLVKAHDSRS